MRLPRWGEVVKPHEEWWRCNIVVNGYLASIRTRIIYGELVSILRS